MAMFTLHREPAFDAPPVLVHAFTGFVDAGSGTRIAGEHLLAALDHELVATFDPDDTLDYRARRPRMQYRVDRFVSVDVPQVTLHEVTDLAGRRFLLLVGPEPDYRWQEFLAAVEGLARRFGAQLAVGLGAIPWPAPHTRPMGVTVHGSEPALLQGHASVIGEIEVPGHVGAMLEFHLGQQGIPSMGITAQVPHYLGQFEYPRAAQVLVEALGQMTGLRLPVAELMPAAAHADREVAEQLAGNDEFATVVAALEQQYDQLLGGQPAQQVGTPSTGLADLVPEGGMPTGDEIAAQVEQFLAGLDDGEAPKGA